MFNQNKQIILRNKKVFYTLRKSSRARRIRLAVYPLANNTGRVGCGGNVVVTLPYHAAEYLVEKFLKEKARWLLAKLEFFSRPPVAGVPDEHADYAKYKQEALVLVTDRAAYFSSMYNVAYKNIRIKKQKTCWGSCSKKGNLNFNYKILFLPLRVRDYVIIHELCHLKEFNHSRAFWNLVAQAAPDYQEARRDLKINGLLLS